jgi:hypothetical protein
MDGILKSHTLPAGNCEVNNGLAACAVRQGRLDEAHIFANKARDYRKEIPYLIGMGSPGWAYRSCADAFQPLVKQKPPRLSSSAHQYLMTAASKINMPEWRQSFLENVPEHRWIMEM